MDEGAVVVAANEGTIGEDESIPTLVQVTAEFFLETPLLHKEVFGPYSLLVACESTQEMLQVAKAIEGQLTCTLMANEEEAVTNTALIGTLKKNVAALSSTAFQPAQRLR